VLEILKEQSRFFVKQTFEIAEMFGFESRNKYRICDEAGTDIAFAAEQQKGIWNALFRQSFGHWRTFDVHVFSTTRVPLLIASHPFRWFFQRLEVRDAKGIYLGVIERRFGILRKRFVVEDAQGRILFDVSSPFWRIWTFPFRRAGHEMARVTKKWSGIGYEMFTDRDDFLVEYLSPQLNLLERTLILVAALYIDLKYFERKAGNKN
jgi:hypothetical protein